MSILTEQQLKDQQQRRRAINKLGFWQSLFMAMKVSAQSNADLNALEADLEYSKLLKQHLKDSKE